MDYLLTIYHKFYCKTCGDTIKTKTNKPNILTREIYLHSELITLTKNLEINITIKKMLNREGNIKPDTVNCNGRLVIQEEGITLESEKETINSICKKFKEQPNITIANVNEFILKSVITPEMKDISSLNKNIEEISNKIYQSAHPKHHEAHQNYLNKMQSLERKIIQYKNDHFPPKENHVICIAQDKLSKKFYIGKNGNPQNNIDKIKANPKLNKLRSILPKFSEKDYRVENCAEVAAAINALMDDKDLGNLVFSSIEAIDGKWRGIVPCDNCHKWVPESLTLDI